MTKHVTIIALSAWKYDRTGENTGDPSGLSQTYCDDPEEADGWSVRLEHRAAEDGPDGLHEGDLMDPVHEDPAMGLDVDVKDYAGAYLIAAALNHRYGWELREY